MNSVENYCSKDVIKILVGNKCDLEGERRISFDDMQDKANDMGLRAFETSALESRRGTIEELFSEIAAMIVAG